jgi:hypothetical protein
LLVIPFRLQILFHPLPAKMPPRRNRSRRATLDRTLSLMQARIPVGARVDMQNLSVQGFLEMDTVQVNPAVVVVGNNNRILVEQDALLVESDSELEELDGTNAAPPFLRGQRLGDRNRNWRNQHLQNNRRNRRDAAVQPYHNRQRRMNPPSGGAPVRTLVQVGYHPMAAAVLAPSNANSLCPETNHLPNIRFFDIQYLDNQVRTLGVIDGSGTETIGKLLKLWHYQVAGTNGLYRSWHRVLDDPRFAAMFGPLKNSFRSDLLLAAALLAYAAGRGPNNNRTVGDACIPMNSRKTCARLLLGAIGGPESYDRALVMAATIVHHNNLPNREYEITIDDIMDYDIYTPFNNRHRSKLHSSGIVSAESQSVGNGTDLQAGVFLPMFLFLDTLLPDHEWRGLCPINQVNVTPSQHLIIENNVRIHSEYF